MACPGPSLPGAFSILGSLGRDRLVQLQHRLRALGPGCRGAELLHAMVLLQLGQEAEARSSLEALRADAGARLVARQWAGVDSTEAPEEAPEESAEVSWTVARLYHLLAEERLCPASMRDAAYQAALRTPRAKDGQRLAELQEEAQDPCGRDVVGSLGGFQPLCSDRGRLPASSASPSGARSLPRPIEGQPDWSRGCSLRSTGSPISLASNLEISQSPTMPLGSPHRSTHGPSKLCREPQASPVPEPVPTGCQEPEEMSWPPAGDTARSLELPDCPAPRLPEAAPGPASAHLPDSPAAPETSSHFPVECTEVSTGPGPLPLPMVEATESPGLVKDRTAPQLSGGEAAPQKSTPCPPTPAAPLPSAAPSSWCWPPLASLSPGTTSSEPGSPEQFYNFVILHARADEQVALRVRERLEALGVPDGATFCEDFQVPGRGELRCLQDAIDHSGFTILLLTPNFNCRLSLHQVSQALMSSFTQHGRQDCVVPFLPLESSLEQLSPDTAGLLAGLVWLDESSKIFPRKVASTFKPQKLQARKAHWRKEQDVRALRAHSQHLEGERRQAAAVGAAYSACLQSYLSWQAQVEKLQAAFGSHLSLGTHGPHPSQVPFGGQAPLAGASPFPAWPGGPPPAPPSPWPAGPAPAFPPPAPPQAPGVQPLIIHHAQMVQLGLNNHMWNQRAAQAPEDETPEAEGR
ncbi:TIR domain-containing adapter molecule 1 [Sciurus carolinensis]|uniref:TIR domain-containing adapter molecule 1 n=1 Tax=Sciurus carolinensis TaxID=30640 RepID=UPI001FB35F31|nr:TIR domain-containing adapter molecule 1 [Sciurus carolinensis]XP_047388504.1 TIR domain-containing adapter molecule 1 [Sciurus carolinensis]